MNFSWQFFDPLEIKGFSVLLKDSCNELCVIKDEAV
jgi:hypothetical protein